MTDDDYIRIGLESIAEREAYRSTRGGLFKRLTSATLGGFVGTEFETLSPFESKCFGSFVQKVPVKWRWNIIGAKGYSRP